MKQQTYIGNGEVKKLENVLQSYSPKRIFLVTSKESYESCGAKEKISSVISKYSTLIFSDFEINPKIEDVKKGINFFRGFNPDVLVAVGGGTVLDMAKLLNTLSLQEGNPEEYVLESRAIKDLRKPFIAIPTTSGTGSEATHFAVVYVNGDKYSLANKGMLPDYSIIDPRFTTDLPRHITASTGVDALSQAIESYWATKSTEESRKYAKEAIKLVMKNLEGAVNNPSEKSRFAMSKAANLSGRAINITKTTAAHAVSYPFTSYFNIPHGHAVGLTLGKFLVYNREVTEEDCIDKRGVKFVQDRMGELCSLLGAESINLAKVEIDSLMRSIGLETDLHKLGVISEKDFDLIISNVNPERLNNNPRLVTEKDLIDILKQN